MTKEKRLIATNKTEEERDRLTEVWKKRIVSEKGYSETIAERIAEKVNHWQTTCNMAMPSSHTTDRTVVFS